MDFIGRILSETDFPSLVYLYSFIFSRMDENLFKFFINFNISIKKISTL